MLIRDKKITGSFEDMLENEEWFERARYKSQLEHWFSVFPDRRQTLVIKSEDFFKNTEYVFRKVCNHLNIPYEDVDFTPSFQAQYKEGLSPEKRSDLEKIFSEQNKELKSLIGFSWDD